MSDSLILTDLFDNEIGTLSKSEAHRLGRLHRAFSVFITDGDKMLIQKRHRDKYHSGGLWANACCSHPRFGETLDQAVPRRLLEELGVTLSPTTCSSMNTTMSFSAATAEIVTLTALRSKSCGGSRSTSSNSACSNIRRSFPRGS